jgi:hypothetical protein
MAVRDLAPASSFLRIVLWSILIGLTAALLAYPRQMTLGYSPIQSLDAVSPFHLFASLYYALMVTLAALLLLQSRASLWQGLVLVGIFALVYFGFWDIPFAAVKHQDSVLNAATAVYIRVAGMIPVGHPNITYTDFPGLHILTAALAAVTSLPMPNAVTAVTLLMDLLRAGILYLICLCLLEEPRWAGIATLLVMQGSIVLARLPFYPGTLGFVFAQMFLLMALRQRVPLARRSDVLIVIVVVVVTAVTHFVISALVVFLLVGMWLVAYARRGLKEPSPISTLFPICIIFLTTWLVYAAVQTFDGLVSVSAEISGNLQRGQFLRQLFILGRTNVGVQVPVWATTLKLFWLVLLLGVGTVVALPGLRRLQSLRSVEARALGALVGIILLSVLATLVSTAGSEFLRYPLYAPLVTAPLLLLAISRLYAGWRRLGLGVVVLSLVALAVPTFLVHYPTVRMDMFYPYEAAPAQMLARYGDSTDLSLTAPALGYVPYVAYLPNAQYAGTPIQSDLKDKDGVWAHLDDQVDNFIGGTDERVNIYVLSRRPRVFYRHNFGIPLDDPRWDAIRGRLEGQAAVYHNGFVTLYEATAPVVSGGGRGGR